MNKILLIEDDIKIGNLLKEYMSGVGYHLTHELTPKKGLSRLRRESYDLLVLDIMLPEMNGFDLCKELRTFSDIPVIMLTARGEVTDKVVGLEVGADDYMSKPFSPRELIARIESIKRRVNNKVTHRVKSFKGQGLEIDFEKFKTLIEGKEIKLTSNDYELLKVFVGNPGQLLSRDDIMNKIQGVDSEVFSRSIDIAVSRLRHKLGESKEDPKFIKTIWGSGYMFIGVEE